MAKFLLIFLVSSICTVSAQVNRTNSVATLDSWTSSPTQSTTPPNRNFSEIIPSAGPRRRPSALLQFKSIPVIIIENILQFFAPYLLTVFKRMEPLIVGLNSELGNLVETFFDFLFALKLLLTKMKDSAHEIPVLEPILVTVKALLRMTNGFFDLLKSMWWQFWHRFPLTARKIYDKRCSLSTSTC